MPPPAGARAAAVEPRTVDRSGTFLQHISDGQDDLLATFQLVAGHHDLEARVMDRLVDRLLDGLIAELWQNHEAGDLDDMSYQLALIELIGQAHRAGLAAFPIR